MEKYGRKFAIVKMPRNVLLIPIPSDPLKSLREQGKRIPVHLTPEDLKRIAGEEAAKEAMGNWKRLQKLGKSRR
ncbi:MAG: AbrB family transcriptional regulator [Candidatus Aenigmarchaeota archaeon]|nr:AbrB family transcriptional regulator [Candidatus Aenigmarchaeota archaeon]